MNMYTVASRFNKQAAKRLAEIQSNYEACGMPFDKEAHARCIRGIQIAEFKENARLGIELMMEYQQLAEDMGFTPITDATQTYFITIRPDETKIDFPAFKQLVEKYITRKCFVEYAYSFEQTGVDENTIGTGYHVHVVAKMKQRSKGKVLDDTFSTFQHCTVKNCIEVELCKNPGEVVQNYLLDYKSKDKHKIKTMEPDATWRKSLELASLYTNKDAFGVSPQSGPPALTSPVEQAE